MIKKFVTIQNQGNLRDAIQEILEVVRVNIVYGENGRGKSTFTDIFNAIKSKNFDFLTKKCETKNPFVSFILQDDSVPCEIKCTNTLEEVAKKLPNTFVFDRHFVDSNVYSGLSHDKDHKEQLFTLLLGEKVLELTQKQNELQDTITQTTNSIKILKSTLDSIVKTIDSNKDHTVLLSTVLKENFSQDTTSNEISKLDKQLSNSKTILDRPLLSTLELPAVFNLEKIKTELSESIKDISTAAYDKVQTHLTEFHVPSSWINQGFSKIKNNLCPLCGSSTEDNELIKSFPSFFNQEYDRLAKQIEQSAKQISQEIVKRSHVNTIDKNGTLLPEWFDDNEKLNISLQLKETFDTYFNFVHELYQTKQLRLLDELPSEAIEEPYKALSSKIKDYNEQIEVFNTRIKEIKIQASDLNKLKDQQINLKFQLVQFQKNDEIESFQADLTTLQRNKEDLRLIQEQIKTEIDSFLKQYGESINKCLKNFGVDFQIDLAKKVQSNIKNIQAEITVLKDNSPLEFKNSLSEGDKHALAFAIWLSTLPEDLSTAIITIDDPMTSLDEHRAYETINQINNLASKASQLFICTHLKSFAKELHCKLTRDQNSVKRDKVKIFQLNRESTLLCWENFSSDTKSGHLKSLDAMKQYLNDESSILDPRILRSDIRLVLDEFINLKYFSEMNGSDPGPFVKNQLKTNSSLQPFRKIADLYFYTNASHHSLEDFNRTELAAKLRELFDLIRNNEKQNASWLSFLSKSK